MKEIKKKMSYLKEHGKVRRWIVVAVWFLICAGLIINYGILNSNAGKIVESHLNEYQDFPGTGTQQIKLTSRLYDTRQQRMIVKFQLQEPTDIKSEILPQYLKYKIATVSPEKTKTVIIPITNTKYVVVIDNLKPDFKAIQIQIANKTPQTTTSNIDDPYTKFIIKDKRSIEKEHVSSLSPKKFAISAINDEIRQKRDSIKRNKKSINNYKAAIKVDKQKINEEKLNRKYQIASKQKETDEDIDSLKTDIESNKTSIQNKKDKNIKHLEEIDLLKEKQKAIEMGNYKLPKVIKQGQINIKN